MNIFNVLRNKLGLIRLSTRNIYQKKIASFPNHAHSLVVLPDIPKNYEEITLENFKKISFYDVFLDISRDIQKYETSLNEIFSNNVDLNHFDESMLKFERLTEKLDGKIKLVRMAVMINGGAVNEKITHALDQLCTEVVNQVLILPEFRKMLNQYQKMGKNDLYSDKCLQRIHANCALYGIYQNDQKHHNIDKLINKLLKLVNEFSMNEYMQRKQKNFILYRNALTEDAPVEKYFNKFISSNDSNIIEIPLNTEITDYFLQYCRDPVVRNNLWHRVRQFTGPLLRDRMTNVLYLQGNRYEIAMYLGYSNYASLLLDYKQRMATSNDEINNILLEFRDTVVSKAKSEYSELLNYARTHEQLQGNLEQWDYCYIKHNFKKNVLGVDDDNLKLISTSLDASEMHVRLLKFACMLYGITINEAEEVYNMPSYVLSGPHKNQQCRVIMDFAKDSQHDMYFTECLTVDNQSGREPIAYINCSLRPDSQPNFMLMKEIIHTINKVISWTFSQREYSISEILNVSVPELPVLKNYFLYRCIVSSDNVLNFLFPDSTASQIDDYRNIFIDMEEGTLYEKSIRLYEAFSDHKIYQQSANLDKVIQSEWNDLFGSNSSEYFAYAPKNEWIFANRDLFITNGTWSGVALHSPFWARYHMDPAINNMINCGYADWNPNSSSEAETSLNPTLRLYLDNYRRIFFEDPHQILPQDMLHAFRQYSPVK